MAETSSGQFRSVSITKNSDYTEILARNLYRGRRRIYGLIQFIEVPPPQRRLNQKYQHPERERREEQKMSCRELVQKTKEIAKIRLTNDS